MSNGMNKKSTKRASCVWLQCSNEDQLPLPEGPKADQRMKPIFRQPARRRTKPTWRQVVPMYYGEKTATKRRYSRYTTLCRPPLRRACFYSSLLLILASAPQAQEPDKRAHAGFPRALLSKHFVVTSITGGELNVRTYPEDRAAIDTVQETHPAQWRWNQRLRPESIRSLVLTLRFSQMAVDRDESSEKAVGLTLPMQRVINARFALRSREQGLIVSSSFDGLCRV